MSKISHFHVEILENKQVASGIFELVLASHPAMNIALPGQFVEVAVSTSMDPLLRRPLSICSMRSNGHWSLMYRTHGRGTQMLAEACPGSKLDVLGPLGRGFDLPTAHHDAPIVVVGGGVGVPPLVYLAQKLKNMGMKTYALLGFASADVVICTEALRSLDVEVYVATDDGTLGHHGLVTSLLDQVPKPSFVYTCGPIPMMRAVAHFCAQQSVFCQVSLEEKMACGVGACLSCVCPVRRTGETGWHWQRVCKEGPVFNASEVAFDVMR